MEWIYVWNDKYTPLNLQENVEDEFCNEEAEANAKRPMDETMVVEEK